MARKLLNRSPRSMMLLHALMVVLWWGGCSVSQYVPAHLEGTSTDNLVRIVGGYKEYGSRPDLTKLLLEIDGVPLRDGNQGKPQDVYVKPGKHTVKYLINIPKGRHSGPARILCISGEACMRMKNSSTFNYDRQPRTCSLTFEAGQEYGRRELEKTLSAAGCPVIGEKS